MLRSNGAFGMNGKDTDDVNEGMNEFDDNLYGPCFTVNSGQWLYR